MSLKRKDFSHVLTLFSGVKSSIKIGTVCRNTLSLSLFRLNFKNKFIKLLFLEIWAKSMISSNDNEHSMTSYRKAKLRKLFEFQPPFKWGHKLKSFNFKEPQRCRVPSKLYTVVKNSKWFSCEIRKTITTTSTITKMMCINYYFFFSFVFTV